MSENVRASTSRIPKGLHCLYRENVHNIAFTIGRKVVVRPQSEFGRIFPSINGLWTGIVLEIAVLRD
jgi:hypothetical protein